MKKPTDFQRLVWKEIEKIPYGETRSYRDIAIRIGRPRSYRAVANACGKNPLPIIRPCHRVICSNGEIGGYSINGGTFQIDQVLISFVKTLLDQEHTEAVLLDIYNNPIKVELEEFLEEITSRYFEATNEYHAEYEKLKKSRKVHKLIDLDINDT